MQFCQMKLIKRQFDIPWHHGHEGEDKSEIGVYTKLCMTLPLISIILVDGGKESVISAQCLCDIHFTTIYLTGFPKIHLLTDYKEDNV